MKLIASLTSPFARKVRVVLAEKRIEYDFDVQNPWLADTPVPLFNPLGKVPVLVLDDGTTLFDSRVIVEYLDTVTPVTRLIPAGNRERTLVKRWEALGDGVCEAAANIFLERKRASKQQSQDWINRQEAKVESGLKAIAEELGNEKWCFGDGYTLADVAVGCALGYLDFRFPEINWREPHPHLAQHWDRLSKRPSFQNTVPKG